MDRQFTYAQEIPLDTDVLNTNLYAYIGLSKLAGAILGTGNTLVNNATCVPTAPASMQVSCGPCEIYSLQNIDNTPYSDIPADTAHQILKQGINLDATTLNITAPLTPGYSQNYLIQFGFLEQDGGATVLNYYNAADPTHPFSGPGDSGTPNFTVRADQVSIQAKSGTPAPTGSQATPTPDTGYVGGFVVTVAYGATAITAANITNYATPNSNFINETLQQKISQATGDARYAQASSVQKGQYVYAVDTGTANNYAASLSPTLTSYTAGLGIRLKVAHNNTGASTININGLGAKAITYSNGSALIGGELVAGMIASLMYDGTQFQFINSSSSSSSVNANQVQSNVYNFFADVSASVNTIKSGINSISPPIISPTAGISFYVKIANTNTGSTTLVIQQSPTANYNFNITNIDGTSLSSSQLIAGMIAEFVYDGTNLQLMNPAISSSSAVTGYQIQQNSWTSATDTGTLNHYKLVLPNTGVSGATSRAIISFNPITSNTGACKIDVFTLVNADLINIDGSPLSPYQILNNNITNVQYSAAYGAFVLLNPVIPQATLYKPIYLIDNGSSGNNYVSTTSPYAIFTQWIVGLPMYYLVPLTNTGASTFDYTPNGSIGALNIKKPNGAALVAGSMVAGMIAHFIYDGTNLQLLNPQA
ncbi:hypothetical protein AQUSIP_12810 [Aquicella siphonis]|uniref:Uncharacterized protein n=1 Tax=Aquicella siphonis TaxID=254247 RepID=A0A5E4PG45_9COXI|nr:hypothetical protein [Aquicella siphonis]VVC75980.1 hypothetical protein AQUSIP_12810 [Aquicella siphonis]